MAQDPRSLPQGAGALTNPDYDDDRPSSAARTGTADLSRSPASSAVSDTGSSYVFDDNDSSPYASRELVLTKRSNKPSTATIVGAALAGAIAGGAIPFMLSGKSSSSKRSESAVVEESIIINKPANELYVFWRDFTNFPQFMDNIKSVEKLSDRKSHWVIKAPAGTSVEFDSYITEDIPGRLIAWQSEEGASVPNRGRVEFIETASGTGTNVRTTISYDPPAGAAGRLIAKLFQREPSAQAKQDLQRLKQLMESSGRA